jgi:hypothetical protein
MPFIKSTEAQPLAKNGEQNAQRIASRKHAPLRAATKAEPPQRVGDLHSGMHGDEACVRVCVCACVCVCGGGGGNTHAPLSAFSYLTPVPLSHLCCRARRVLPHARRLQLRQ